MKNKKGYIVFILVATAVIVFMGVNLGLKASSLVQEEPKYKREEIAKKEETTKDFQIEYKEESYALRNKKGKEMIENKRYLPILTSDDYQMQADKITSLLAFYSDVVWDDITEQSKMYVDELDTKVGVNYIPKVIEQNDVYFSFVYDLSGSLGEFSKEDRKGYTFSVVSGDILTLDSITTDKTKLIETCFNKLSSYIVHQEYKGDLDEKWYDKLKVLIDNEGNWYLTKDGISFTFPKYSLGTGYIGVISYTVSFDDLGDLILEEYKNA
jgi:hypothetical protein